MEFQGAEISDAEGSHEITTEEVDTENGLPSINGLTADNGLCSDNGLMSDNGLNADNGLMSDNGLSSVDGLMTTTAGRQTVSYLVKCALATGTSLVKGSYTFAGQLGLAPEWKTGGCTTSCKETISACLMAHVNTSGNHYPLWLIGPQTALGWGRSNAKPFIESAFFGNLFVSPPKAYYCNGPDYERVPVKGRIGAETSTTIFHNPYSGEGMCNDYCSSNSDGYTSCSNYARPITVYRDLDTANSYTICEGESTSSPSCLAASTSTSSVLLASPSSTSTSQRWMFERFSTGTKEGQYRIKNVYTGKYMTVTSTSEGTTISTATGSTSSTGQRWNLTEILLATLGNGSFGIQNNASARYIDDRSYSNGNVPVQIARPGSNWYVGQAWKLTLKTP